MPTHTFILNGNRVSVDCADNIRLLWVLRDLLGVKGPKYGCGLDACHACTSHINGKQFRPCSVEVQHIKPHDHITTIEGLPATAGADLHPMQQAWIDFDVAQCGYCQPGQIMTAVALINQVHAEGREITDADLDAIRNVCRCGTYFRIREAITSATPTPGCPLVSGKLSGTRLGNITLGMTRAQARHAYATSKKTTRGHTDTFCLTPTGIHVGYATPALLDTLPEHQRAHYENRVIWASTTSTFYNLHRIRPGTTLQDAHHHAKLTGPLNHHYYLTTHGPATGILKTSNKNIVQEIGIAAKALTKTHHQQLDLLKTFR